MPTDRPYPKEKVKAVFNAALGGYKVERWLAGSTVKADRPTLAELEAAGYKVVKA